MALENLNKKLNDLLLTRNFQPEIRDMNGKTISNPSEAKMFSFDFVASSGKDYGTVVIYIGDISKLQMFYADNIGKGMESADKEEWYKFLEQLSLFAKRNRMSFDLRNINRLRYTMQGQAALQEGLFEAWTGRKNVSYNANPDAVRLMIRHNRDIREGEQRFRHIESLFVETTDGERFRLPFKSLAGGRAMCEHVRSGGRPYDIRGQHISELVNEIAVLTRFNRAQPGALFETQALVEAAQNHLVMLKETLRSLGSRRGYAGYFEAWNPAEITDADLMIEQVRNTLVTQDIDSRIEDALPFLARLPVARISEADIFESWAEKICQNI